MRRTILISAFTVLSWPAFGQQQDNPTILPVYYYGEGIVSQSGQPWSQYSFGSELGATTQASGSFLTGGSTVYSAVATGTVIPGKEYMVQVTSTNFAVVTVHFAAIPGYNIYVGPYAAVARQNEITLGANYTFYFRLESINDLTQSLAEKRGGQCSSPTEDKAIWYVGLGRLRGGRFAGAVGFRASGISSAIYQRTGLMYDSVDPSEVSVTRDTSGYLTSITAREVYLTMTTDTATKYHIDVFQRKPDGTTGPIFITYTVQQYGAGSAILIVKAEGGSYSACRLAYDSPTRKWTLYDWRKSDVNGNFLGTNGVYPFPDKRVETVVAADGLSETTNYGITNSVSTPTLVKQKTYAQYLVG